VADSLDAKAKPKQKRRCVTSSVIAIRAPTYKEASRAQKKKKEKTRKKKRRKGKAPSGERRKIPGETGLASRSPYRLFISRHSRQALRNGLSPLCLPLSRGEGGGREASTSVSSRHREIPLDCLSKSISSLRFRLLVESGLFSPRNFQTELSSRSCNLDLVE
jgi:hypothetical protein